MRQTLQVYRHLHPKCIHSNPVFPTSCFYLLSLLSHYCMAWSLLEYDGDNLGAVCMGFLLKWKAKLRTGKSHTDTGVKQHRRSYVDAVKGMASRIGMTHKLTYMQNNEKIAPMTGMKHNAIYTQNNEKPVLVFTSKEEDGGKTFALVVEGKQAAGIVDTGTISDSPEDGSLLFIRKGQGEPPDRNWALGLKHIQPEPVDLRREPTQEGPLSPLAREHSITPGPQGLNGSLHSPSNLDASNSRLHIDRESPEDIVGQRTEMASNWKIRKKSLVEISGSKLSTGKHGCRSKRVHWQLMNTGVPSSQLFTEAADSGIDLNDSQIENMNRIICKQDSHQADTELSPTPSQIWSFLTRIGVKGTATTEDLVNHIKTMEQRDLKNFLETVQVPEADCAQEGRVVQCS
ncbi:hypothetical protein Ancab_036713 [Ancistrocladus abbreviatus]